MKEILAEDDEQREIREFTQFHPIWKGLLISALTGVGLFLLIAVVVFAVLEGWF